MPAHFPLLRRVSQIAVVLTAGLLASCATKKDASTPPATASEKKKKEKEKKPSPSPSPSPTPAAAASPAPQPTPEVRYIARVSVEGGEETQQEITQGSQPEASPTPQESPSPTPTPGPTPKPKSKNILTKTWEKIFPPKPTPEPMPGATGKISVRVTTEDGREVERVLREGDEMPPEVMATPTPVPLKPPGENFLARTWHMVFPKKETPPPATLPQWIGTIKLVNERDGYALIDSQQGYYAIPDGEILNSVGGGSESGVLRVTTDRNPPFFIADIVGGKPRAGDRVYSPKP